MSKQPHDKLCDSLAELDSLLDGEPLIPVLDAIEEVLGKRVHPATAHRWRLRGVGGVKLITIKAAGMRMTTVRAVREFFAATTAAADGEQANLSTRTNRQRAIGMKRDEEYLASEGI